MSPSSSPATLPIRTPDSQPHPPLAFLQRVSATLHHSLSLRRPFSELIDRTAFSRPPSLSSALSRLRRNATYFRLNYLLLLALILALSLLSHPLSLLLLASLLAAWAFLYLLRPLDHPLVLFGRTLADREVLAGLVLFTVVVVFLTSVGSLLISGMLIAGGIVCVHGAFRVPEDLFMDDQENANQSFLSFLAAAPSTTRL